MITDLSNDESIFIEIQRIFNSFFGRNHYHLREYSYNDRDGDSVTFENNHIRQDILFSWGFAFEINIIKHPFLYKTSRPKQKNILRLTEIKQYFKEYKDIPEILASSLSFEILNDYYNFINSELMPVIKGEMWIDELLKKKGITTNNPKS